MRPNFRWRSGSWSGTFISGTRLIGLGTGKKRAGNPNFGCFTVKEGSFFGQFSGLVWFPGGVPCNLVVPVGHWVVPGGLWVLPGGCLVVTGHKMKVLESLEKVVFCPLAPRGGFGGDPLPILGRTGPGACRGGFGGILPHYRVKMGRPLVPRGGFGGILPHSRAYLAPGVKRGGLGGSSPRFRA